MKQSLKIFLLVAVMSLGLTACATGYKQSGFLTGDYGYIDKELSQKQVRITYTGNTGMKTKDSYHYAMRRAAELTKKRGFRYFEVLSNQNFIQDAPADELTGAAGLLISAIIDAKIPVTKLTIKLTNNKTEKAYDVNRILAQTS